MRRGSLCECRSPICIAHVRISLSQHLHAGGKICGAWDSVCVFVFREIPECILGSLGMSGKQRHITDPGICNCTCQYQQNNTFMYMTNCLVMFKHLPESLNKRFTEPDHNYALKSEFQEQTVMTCLSYSPLFIPSLYVPDFC